MERSAGLLAGESAFAADWEAFSSGGDAGPPTLPVAAKLTIVHVITRFIRGGADENTLLTCNGQARLGHAVTLIHGREFHPDMCGRLDPRVRVLREDSLVREIEPLNDVCSFFALMQHFRRERPDVVHTHESKAGIVGRAAARAAGAPCIIHGVHILPHLNAGLIAGLLYRSCDWVAAKGTDVFVDVSDGMRDACLRAGFGRADNHVVVESGMDLSAFQSSPPLSDLNRALLSALEPDSRTLLLIAGALEPRKRVREFLDVFASLANEAPSACLLVAGEGPERDAIAARIRALGLERRVLMLGHRADLAAWIAVADICVHSAAREGLPRVVVQYVATGKPVVVGALPGIDRVVADGANGFITDLDRLEAMRAPILALLREPEMRARMGRASAAMDLSDWSEARMIERLEEAYRVFGKPSYRAAS